MYLFLITIFIHEFGHLLFGILCGINNIEIVIYPFGGITKFNSDLNIKTNKELFILLGGIIFQLLFFLLLNILYKNIIITTHVYVLLRRINYLLISFNFMPIIPLDGGKLLNILLDKIFPYKLSNIIALSISIIFLLIFLILNKTYYAIFLTIFLIKCIIIEINIIDYKYNIFLFERYKNKYNFNKIRIINKHNNFKRDYYHIINNELECSYLHKLFDRNS